MLDIAKLTAIYSLFALVWAGLTLYKFEAKRCLAYGFLVLAMNIVLNLLGVFARVYPILYSLRIIYATSFLVYVYTTNEKKKR